MNKTERYNLRQARLRRGNREFGCNGTHIGYGTWDCPRTVHHHHDVFCAPPTKEELLDAGIDPQYFRKKSRIKKLK